MTKSNESLLVACALTAGFCLIALFLGLAVTKLNAVAVFAASFAVIGLLLSLRYTFLPVLFAIFVVCDVVPFPKGGRLFPFFVVGCCLLSICLALARKRKLPHLLSSVWAPFAWYLLTMCWGYFYGTSYLGNDSAFALLEFQQVTSLLLLPALLIAFEVNGRSNKLLNLLLFIGLTIAVLTLFQYFTGISLGGRVEQLETLGSVNSDVTRATIPGKLFVLFGLFFYVLSLFSPEQKAADKVLNILCVLLLSFALLVSFGRALWACSVIGLLFCSLLLGTRQFVKVFVLVALLAGLGIVALQIFSPSVYSAVLSRATSVLYEGGTSSSYGWRITENFYATQVASKNPFLGIGFGGEYKPLIVSPVLFPSQTSYIHSSYHFILLKLGYLGAILMAIFAFSVVFEVAKGFRRDGCHKLKMATAAALATLSAIAVLSITQPEIVSFPCVAFMAGVLALSFSWYAEVFNEIDPVRN